jgi:hypothetical protein
MGSVNHIADAMGYGGPVLITIIVTVAAVAAAAGAVISGERNSDKTPIPIPVRTKPRRN